MQGHGLTQTAQLLLNTVLGISVSVYTEYVIIVVSAVVYNIALAHSFTFFSVLAAIKYQVVLSI